MLSEVGVRPALDALAERLGASIVSAEAVGWGDARATCRLVLADGRSLAARRFGPAESPARAVTVHWRMTRLATAGLPVPPSTLVEVHQVRWLLTPWVDGQPGAAWLGDPDRARHLAQRMGELALGIRRLGADAPYDRDGSDTPDVSFVHGDFAPVNVVLDDAGDIRALLDLEHAGRGPALLDVAWWGWVVRHHHPEAWSVSWPTFLVAAGLQPGPVEARLQALVLRALEARAVTAGDTASRGRWLDRLAAARAWQVPGDQAT